MSFSGNEINRFFTNVENGFIQSQGALGLNSTIDGRSVAYGDLDNDGDLDLVLRNLQSPNIQIFENTLNNMNKFTNIRLIGNKNNLNGIGSKLIASCDNKKQIKEIKAGEGFLSQNPYEISFGFGDCKSNYFNLLIKWPNKKTITYKKIEYKHRIVP